ncbi:hypothetical protein ABT364_04845 [Massilia sp. SR12]
MRLLIKVLAAGMALPLVACGTLQHDMETARENTRDIGLLVQSISQSAAAFQKQRDAIAVSSKVHRDNLESFAMRYEADAYRAAAAWNVAGQKERQHSFESVRGEADKLLARIEQKRARELAQEQELRDTRSAVLYQGTKLNEAAVALLELAEPESRKEHAKFYFSYLKDVREAIKKDSEAEAAAQASAASKAKDKP